MARRIYGWMLQLTGAAKDGQSGGEAYDVTEERARLLAELIYSPTVYNQRFVESLTFVSTGCKFPTPMARSEV